MVNFYVINLDKDRDRWAKQKPELEKAGIQPIRVPGIMYDEVTEEQKNKYFSKFCKYTCPKSVIGSGYAHLNAMRIFYETDPNDICIILEDDAYPKFKDVSIVMDFIKNTLPPTSEWDMCLLHCDGTCPFNKNKRYLPTGIASGSVAGYVITKRGAKYLLDGNHKLLSYFDMSTNLDSNFIKKKLIS